MKTTVNFYEFAAAFENCRPDNFSREGLMCLFEYLEEFEESTGGDFRPLASDDWTIESVEEV